MAATLSGATMPFDGEELPGSVHCNSFHRAQSLKHHGGIPARFNAAMLHSSRSARAKLLPYRMHSVCTTETCLLHTHRQMVSHERLSLKVR